MNERTHVSLEHTLSPHRIAYGTNYVFANECINKYAFGDLHKLTAGSVIVTQVGALPDLTWWLVQIDTEINTDCNAMCRLSREGLAMDAEGKTRMSWSMLDKHRCAITELLHCQR
eukprot:6199510-Pleurochrysis_carterae.AAC.2